MKSKPAFVKCPVCKNWFVNERGLRVHMRMVHQKRHYKLQEAEGLS